MVDDKVGLPERFAAPDSHPMIPAPKLYPVAGHKSVRIGQVYPLKSFAFGHEDQCGSQLPS